jgi:predicted deacylase
VEGSVVRIRDIEARRGSAQRGFIQVGETPLGPIRFPIVIIHGATPGPTLCLTAGVHASEYPGIDAVTQVTRLLDPQELVGTIIAVPVVNPPMYQSRAGFISPIDGLNLNRTFPGRPDGSISEALAHVLLHEVVALADYHIDCHGGDLPEILWPYSGCSLVGDPQRDERGEALARLYSPRIIALYRDNTPLPPTKGSLTFAAADRGVVSILGECGSAGTLDPEDVQTHLRGILNVARFLGMIPGNPVIVGDRLRAVGQFTVTARRGGLVHLKIRIGDSLREGQEIAEICDLFGDVVERVRAPADGIARIIWTHKAVNTGEPLVRCWMVETVPPFPLTDRFARSE